eukprot:scaffold3873_cov177-Ochromonas_danica.AAC.16
MMKMISTLWSSSSFYQLILCILFLSLTLVSSSSSSPAGEFTLGVRDSIMIAHSFQGTEFGPAQQLHGATYTVDVDFIRDQLTPGSNWVIDIGEASSKLSEVLQEFNFHNLNEIFPCENTTTEFMCKAIHRRLATWLEEKSFQGGLRVKL